MKKTIFSILTNYRYYVLFVLGTIAILGIFCDINEELPVARWIFNLLASKAVGFSTGYACFKLITVWEKENRIPELSKLTADEE